MVSRNQKLQKNITCDRGYDREFTFGGGGGGGGGSGLFARVNPRVPLRFSAFVIFQVCDVDSQWNGKLHGA